MTISFQLDAMHGFSKRIASMKGVNQINGQSACNAIQVRCRIVAKFNQVKVIEVQPGRIRSPPQTGASC